VLDEQTIKMNDEQVVKAQERLCQRYGAAFRECDAKLMVGVADNVKGSKQPLNGLRHSVTDTTTGWFVWAGGEPSASPSFFKPMHLKHLVEIRPELIPYLGLPPGWRFLIDLPNGHEDVWRDDSLLLLDED
jgi:hypothetical protein